jgi:UDP-GlcNAc:undecaprenyl-phosphate GlcNAc-1-phosphate transferase
LFFPLLILAVPALDATFVVAKRIKYRRPVYSADRWHFHHRFANIGFSQRRTVLYLYAWTLSLAALALAMRFVPYSDDDGTLHTGWTLVIVGFALVAAAASVYLVIVLEILKFKRFRERELRRQVETGEIAALSESEIDSEIEREMETGEFQAVRPPDGGGAAGSGAGPPGSRDADAKGAGPDATGAGPARPPETGDFEAVGGRD